MRCRTFRYREFWGEAKRAELLASLEQEGAAFEAGYTELAPSAANRFSLRSVTARDEYATWIAVRDLPAAAPLNGPVERRGMALIDMDRTVLAHRMGAYFDAQITNEAVRLLHSSLMMTGNRIDGPKARRKLLSESSYQERRIVRFPWKPFDIRWCYLDNIRPLYSEPSPDLIALAALPGQAFFITRDDADTPGEGPPAFFSSRICDYDFLRGHARFFATMLPSTGSGIAHEGAAQLAFDYSATISVRPNLSVRALSWLTSLNLRADAESSRLVWLHALATTYSSAYRAENGAAIRQGWPRIPLPGSANLLRASASLGERLAILLDSDVAVPGVTAGTLRPELSAIAVPATVPGAARDWRLTGWGTRTDKGVTMPGRGRTDLRPYSVAEAATGARTDLLGAQTCDIWMNGASHWRNIPEQVWETHIGGYQVLKKWLSYRDASILDRPLTEAEVSHVQSTARRLAAILLMGPDLDASFRACAAAHVVPATAVTAPPV